MVYIFGMLALGAFLAYMGHGVEVAELDNSVGYQF